MAFTIFSFILYLCHLLAKNKSFGWSDVYYSAIHMQIDNQEAGPGAQNVWLFRDLSQGYFWIPETYKRCESTENSILLLKRLNFAVKFCFWLSQILKHNLSRIYSMDQLFCDKHKFKRLNLSSMMRYG